MLNSLNSGVAGIRTFQARLDVIGNNIANSNTIAYKAARATFADTFSQTMQGGSSAGGALQVGSGVRMGAIKNDFTRGIFQTTGRSSDLYIDGADGFFIVKDQEGREFATRAGDFVLDKDGYLVTNEGYRVQGFTDHVKEGGQMSTRGDIRLDDVRPVLDPPLATDARPETFTISDKGRITMHLSNGQKYDAGQVTLQKFQDLSLLEKAGSNLYTNLDAAGPLNGTVANGDVPGSNGMGVLISGALEMSNVDLAAEFADLITTQRGFQANARIITTSDEVLQEVVNLKR